MQYKYNKTYDTNDYYCFENNCDEKYMVKKSEFMNNIQPGYVEELISDNAAHKKVEELLMGNYIIPTYQRGYRWNKRNVYQLLNDIFEGKLIKDISPEILKKIINDAKENRFNLLKKHVANKDDYDEWQIKENCKYCIQPLVIMRKGRMNQYDVIDGQQRLTTIAIIIAALKFCGANCSKTVSIGYQSRDGSKNLLKFLWNLPSKCRFTNLQSDIWNDFTSQNKNIGNNIDFEFILNTFTVSIKYFTDENFVRFFKDNFGENNICKYYDYLLFVLINCTEVIWYVADKDISYDKLDERKIFANFNTGKLPLTNADLIKAIFMNPANYNAVDIGGIIKDRQIIIAEKWDTIETELHNPDFWSFVPHQNQYGDKVKNEKYNDTRIGVIFDFLVMQNWLKDNPEKTVEAYIIEKNNMFYDEYYTFNEIERWTNSQISNSKYSNKREAMDCCWNEIRNIFTNLKEFYEDDGRNSAATGKLYNLLGFYIYACSTCKRNGTFYTSHNNNGTVNEVDAYTYLKIYDFINKLSKIPRSEREQHVKEEIRKILSIQSNNSIGEYIKSIKYFENNNDKIAIILLLYNIALLNKSGGIGNRFHFLQYAKQTWQREHIFAQNEDYLNNNKLVDERKSALVSLAKGFNNVDSEAGFKENALLRYINFGYGKELEYCPIGIDDNGVVTDVDGNTIKAFKERYINSSGYNKAYADAIITREKAQNFLNMYGWIEDAEKIENMDWSSTNIRNKLKLTDYIIGYINDNSTFFTNIDLTDEIGMCFKDNTNIHKFIEEDSSCKGFAESIENILHMDVEEILDNAYKKFTPLSEENNDKYIDFYNWINGEQGIAKSVIANIRRKYIREIEKITWYSSEERNMILDMIDEGKEFFEIKGAYNKIRVSKKNKRTYIDEISPSESDTSISEDMGANIPINTKVDDDKITSLENIKDEFIINDFRFIKKAIKINKDTMNKRIDTFFTEEYKDILSDNSMGNFTLLSGEVNASIGKAPYYKKCEEVYKKYKDGSFIPLGTIFVFTDLYTKGLSSASQWLPESRLKYIQDLENTLSDFFGEAGKAKGV